MKDEDYEDSMKNIVNVVINTESGCDPQKGEYSISIVDVIGTLDIYSLTLPSPGTDDITLIKEAISNKFEDISFPEEGFVSIILKESGEWEDVFWHKYYVVESIESVAI